MPSKKLAIEAKAENEPMKLELELFFEYSMDLLVHIGFDGCFKQASPSFEKILGWRREDVISKPFLNFLHPDDCQRSAAEAKANQTGKDTVLFINRYRCKDGSYKSISWNSHPIIEKQIVVGKGQDITERKKTEDSLRKTNEALEERVNKRTEEIYNERHRLYSILETLPVYVIFLDKNYRVPFANKVFRERFGESHGKRCHEFLFKRDSPCENCESYKVLKNNGPHHWEWTGPDGRDYDIYDFPFVEADGSTLILEMGIDITERKHAEKQIRDVSLIHVAL